VGRLCIRRRKPLPRPRRDAAYPSGSWRAAPGQDRPPWGPVAAPEPDRAFPGVPGVLGVSVQAARAIADAFLTAARNGEFGALLEALDPDVVVRSNGADVVRGAAAEGLRCYEAADAVLGPDRAGADEVRECPPDGRTASVITPTPGVGRAAAHRNGDARVARRAFSGGTGDPTESGQGR
jgi:hypothetical protein